jgi:formate hydrogenlyase subunit 6/NADH:ubiquinone oxidoreductase subunit I
MFKDVSRSLFTRPATECYPQERSEAPLHLRGLLHWNRQACTGCGLCSMDCPARAIQVTVLDKKAKRFVFTYHVDRCLFCGQCLQSCKQGSLSMPSEHWELAVLSKAPLELHFGEPDDVEQVLAGIPAAPTPAAQPK